MSVLFYVMANAVRLNVFLVVLLIILCVSLVLLAIFVRFFGLWIQCSLSGTPVALVELIGMQLRRSPVKEIVRLTIMARHGGVDISTRELEKAHLMGADIEKITLALIRSKELGKHFTFEDLLTTDIDRRLFDK